MENSLPNIVLSTIVACTFSLSTIAQKTDKGIGQKSLSENGQPSLITFNEKSTYISSDYQKVFKEQLKLKDNESFTKIKTNTDRQGYTHEKFQLYEKGVKVEFANYTLHSKNGKLASMNGEYYNFENAKVKPTLSAAKALAIATAHIGAKKYLWESPEDAAAMDYKKPKGELVFLPNMKNIGDKRTVDVVNLAYKFDIYATNPISRGYLYIDAVSGKPLFYNAIIKHIGENRHGKSKLENTDVLAKVKNTNSEMVVSSGNADTRYSGSQTIETTLFGSYYILKDQTRGSGIETYNSVKRATYPLTNFTDSDNDWTASEFNNSKKDDGALDAHWGAEKTYDYWYDVHGRDSFDDAGSKIKSWVHFNMTSAGYPDNNNAFWNGSVMTYGDGTGTGGFDILTSLDVVAHEISHGVCSNTADLVYQSESGALNESFSDIWAACIEYHSTTNKSNWLIGEDIERRSGHDSWRSMSDPQTEGQPDTYEGNYWEDANCTPSSTNDYCGIHTNSGVFNHWFYILSEGKSGTNDNSDDYTVTGITIEKAEQIAYRLESVYLTANSTFANARTSGIQSAIDLYGAGSPEVIATTNAFYAVGIGSEYSGGTGDTTPPTTPTDLVESGTTGISTTLSWTASTDNIGVIKYDIYKGTSLIGSSVTTNYIVNGLSTSTSYTFTIKATDAADNASPSSDGITVTTLSMQDYCTSAGGVATEEFIGTVSFGTISNTTTTTNGYLDFTSISTDVSRGQTYTITINPNWAYNVYNEGIAVFIDYNKDGDFSDSGETVIALTPSNSSSVGGSIEIPMTATLGTTRMRISMKYQGIPSACESINYGQVQDYSINILDSGTFGPINGISSSSEKLNTSNLLYPNPVENKLNVSFSDKNNSGFTIVNTLGERVISGKLSSNPIDVSKLNTGTYFIEFMDSQKRITRKFIKK